MIHIWPESTLKEDNQLIIPFTLEWPDQMRRRFWYRLPISCRGFLTEHCDPFLVGSIFTLMQVGAPVMVHGTISPSLLRNLEEFQAAWSSWRPERYHTVEIHAENEEEEPRAASPAAIMAFSGGVDSAFTAYSHRKDIYHRRRQPLQAAIFLEAFDMPLYRTQGSAHATRKAQTMVASLGLEFIPASFNLRRMGDSLQDSHSAKILSLLMLLRRRFDRGLIASSFPYSYLILPWGSNPLTDPLLSCDSFTVIHDGTGFLRSEKIEHIAQWPEARQNLRVCLKGMPNGENCCRCEKCQRVMMYFILLTGEQPPCFPRPISAMSILKTRYLDHGLIRVNQQVLHTARKVKARHLWVKALAVNILLNRLRFAIKTLLLRH